MTLFSQAKQFLDNNIAVIPLQWRAKVPSAKLLPGGSWEMYKSQLPTEYDLKRWLPTSLHNYGVVLGWDNLAVLDFDDHQMYTDWLKTDQSRILSMAFRVKTSRGVHIYFKLQEQRHNLKINKIDFKQCGYVVGPGSTHPSGSIYTAQTEFFLPTIDRLDQVVPGEWLDLAVHTEYVIAEVKPAPSQDQDIFERAESVYTADEDLIKQIKAKHRIEEFFPGASYTERGHRWMVTNCPFHDDQRPSFWIDTARQLCGCWTCNMMPMDVINLYAAMQRMTVNDAIKAMVKF